MEIIINTIEGTFIVPREKQLEIIQWLKQNAVKAGQQPVREELHSNSGQYVGRQLINENK